MNNGVILIPARYESSRFPGKPLALLQGFPLIKWVYTNAASTGVPTYVVTDHDAIEQCVTKFGGQVLRVNEDVPSGTERISLAVEKHLQHLSADWILNVQGDEPLLKGDELRALIEFHGRNSFNISTMVKERHDHEGHVDPNCVKAIYCPQNSQCLYFSREAIPHHREKSAPLEWFQHVGVYLYQKESLKKFCQTPLSYYENKEKLEQLRALEHGMKIGALLTQSILQGVDTPQDLIKVEKILQGG